MHCEICGEQLEITSYEYNPKTNKVTVLGYCRACDHSERALMAIDNYLVQFTIIHKQDGSKKVRIDV